MFSSLGLVRLVITRKRGIGLVVRDYVVFSSYRITEFYNKKDLNSPIFLLFPMIHGVRYRVTYRRRIGQRKSQERCYASTPLSMVRPRNRGDLSAFLVVSTLVFDTKR